MVVLDTLVLFQDRHDTLPPIDLAYVLMCGISVSFNSFRLKMPFGDFVNLRYVYHSRRSEGSLSKS
jgi:hypothetical protein